MGGGSGELSIVSSLEIILPCVHNIERWCLRIICWGICLTEETVLCEEETYMFTCPRLLISKAALVNGEPNQKRICLKQKYILASE